MESTFASLTADIRRVFPDSRFTPVSKPELESIRKRYPGVPDHYMAFLSHIGYGSLGDNFMVYSGLCEPDEIFDTATADRLAGVVFLGDNFAGWIVGFDTRNGWQLVSVDTCYSPEPVPEDAQTVGEFIAERLADQERD